MEIHELNTFSGTLGATDYFVTDNGEDTSKVSADAMFEPINARIDNIITSPAPSAEEIVDARLGADGVTYSSLGEAIRGQVSDLKSDFTELNDALISFENGTSVVITKPTFLYGKRVVNNGSSSFSVSDNSVFACANFISVNTNKNITVKVKNGYKVYAWCTDVDDLDDSSGNYKQLTLSWQTSDFTINCAYQYLVLSVTTVNNTAITGGDLVSLVEEFVPIYETKAQANVFKTDINKLLNKSDYDLTGKVTNGYYVNSAGIIVSTAGTYCYSNPIPLAKGKIVLLTGSGSPSISAITTCDSSGGSRKSAQLYTTYGRQEEYAFSATADTYIIVSYDYSKDIKVVIYDNSTLTRGSEEQSFTTLKELVDSGSSGLSRVGGYELRNANGIGALYHLQNAHANPYYDVNKTAEKYKSVNYHNQPELKSILNALPSEEIDFTPASNGFVRIVVGKDSNDLFFVSYEASSRLGQFGNPDLNALEVTSDFVNFRTIIRSDALSADADGIPVEHMTNVKVRSIKQFADGSYLLAISCKDMRDSSNKLHFYKMDENMTMLIHCEYEDFNGNTVSMEDEFNANAYDWHIFISGNKCIATTYGNRNPDTCPGRVWYTETAGDSWKQVFLLTNHYQDGQAEGVTVTSAHIHGVFLDDYVHPDGTPRMYIVVGEYNRNIFWSDKGLETEDTDWNVIDICNQPFYPFQTYTQVVGGYPFKDGLVFGSDTDGVGAVFRINKLDNGEFSLIEPAYEILPNYYNGVYYCGAGRTRRDKNSPLLLCMTRENAMLTEAENESLNQKHKARIVASYDGYNFVSVWTDDTYGAHDVYQDGEVVSRNFCYCTRGMIAYELNNGDVIIVYSGRDYYYFGGDPLYSETGYSNGCCKVKRIIGAGNHL